TAMTGYQEVITDPSYCGQIVVMTFPLMGNYGINAEDIESAGLHLAGLVVKELPRRPSNYRASAGLSDCLAERGIVGICDIDTRALTRRIRVHGAVRGIVSTEILDDVQLVRRALESAPMVGANLVTQVAPKAARPWGEEGPAATGPAGKSCHLVAIDCGIKYNILRRLAAQGDRVTVAPASASAEEIRALQPDGLLVGNGPGDPATVADTIATLKTLMGEIPILGVCLGHQMMALAAGATTYKLKFGHHGANVPVMNEPASRVEITSQNHGFAVDTASLQARGGVITHVNLNDGSLEGFALPDCNAAAVQFHPEASPGPHDSGHVLTTFVETVRHDGCIDENVFKHSTAR
ncbi:MAG TPA: glutamine-hydrolyzing carbamoyl-phosphate synthase small subunit, partial [Phycisphaerae bacterium]|nr:glutamine-hydrolyzing carbamoyl-phosphate synthase small subunit [Phycisphaerae bacterium]